MKVLLDAHVGHLFRERLSNALGLPDCVYRAADFGWATLQNGALQKMASADGFTHLITYDKDMANKHPPHIPVIATDNPSHGNAGREQGVLSLETIRTYTVFRGDGGRGKVASRSTNEGRVFRHPYSRLQVQRRVAAHHQRVPQAAPGPQSQPQTTGDGASGC